MKIRLLPLLFGSLLVAGCAGNRFHAQPYVEVKSRDSVYVAPIETPAAVDSLLAPLGWAPGRFATELGKEIRFQLNRKGVATPQDSNGVRDRLKLKVDHYDPSDYAVKGSLTTPAGARDIGFEKKSGAAEREDPTIDNIRLIAEKMVEKVRTDPNKPIKREPAPVLMLIPL